jgi:branched-chain amino acid transport system permease protein
MNAGRVARIGVYVALAMIFLAATGLIGRFTELNLVGETVTFGGMMVVVGPLIAGFAVTRGRVVAGERREPSLPDALVAGASVGAVAGAAFGASVVFVDAFGVERVRAIFINVNQPLIDFVTFGQPAIVGALLLTAVSALAGAAGGSYRKLPTHVRKPLGSAVIAILLMGFLQRIVPVMLAQLRLEREWLYSPVTRGLTWVGAAVVAIVAVAVSLLKARYGPRLREQLRSPIAAGNGRELRLSPARLVLLVLIGALVIAIPQLVGSVVSEVLGTVLVFALLGLGLNIVVGYAGLLDLGYVFFFAVGAYSMALLAGGSLNTFTGSEAPALGADLNFWIAIWIVVLIAAGSGLLIGAPVLRLRGDYLALVTLGLGEIVSVLVRSPALEEYVGGANGMRGVTDAAIGGLAFRTPQNFYYLALGFVILAMFVSWRLAASRIGRAWTAMREDEQTADAMGVNTTRYKLLAFAMGGAVGSLGGALFAVKIGSLTPASFEVLVSIQVLGLVILGGIGSLPGVIVGALVLVGLPGLLREFEEYRLLAYGAALVSVMILRPQGLVPNVRRSRELHEEEVAQDQWAKGGTEEPEPEAAPA